MTLCVAALAKVPNTSICKTKVAVYAADFQSEGEIAKAEIGRKVAQVGRNFQIVMISGSYSRAVNLAEMISGLMTEPAKLGQGYQHILEAAVQAQKEHLADEYVAGALGMRYSDFLNIGKDKLPIDVYREMIFFHHSSNVRLQASRCYIFTNESQHLPHLRKRNGGGLRALCCDR